MPLPGIEDLELPGLAPVDFTRTRTSELYPRMFNTQVKYFVAKGGAYRAKDEQWHDGGPQIP